MFFLPLKYKFCSLEKKGIRNVFILEAEAHNFFLAGRPEE